MKISYHQLEISSNGFVIVPVFESERPIEFQEVKLELKLFSGKKDSVYSIQKKDTHFLFVGIGKNPDYKTLKTIYRRIASKQSSYFENQVTLFFSTDFSNDMIEACVSGLFLGSYKLGHFKSTNEQHLLASTDFEIKIISEREVINSVQKGISIAQAQLETLALVDLPSNQITPQYLANWAIEKGKKHGFSVTVFDQAKCFEVGLHSFLAVAQGSEREAQFIIIEYLPTNATKHIGLVGKGITFDTGGLNIKTAGMLHMKCDMAGAAAVLGAMQLIANLKLPHRVTAIIPACENSVDAKSFLPSDVIQSYSGHSIEIIDTDAEGRLILADGLSYLVKNYKPDTVLDIATLTGSAVGTFGYECAALFSNDSGLAKQIQEVGTTIGERSWELPLWDSYASDIESEIADVKNFSGKPVAGAISAAKFLEFFIDNHPSWAHLDIAGVAFGDDEFAKSKHATAYGVHLITKFIENY